MFMSSVSSRLHSLEPLTPGILGPFSPTKLEKKHKCKMKPPSRKLPNGFSRRSLCVMSIEAPLPDPYWAGKAS